MHDFMEDYVDDLVVKSNVKEQHLDYLRVAFVRFKKYRLKMSPMKYAFGVFMWRFLGFKVHKGGISTDEEKIKAIQEMKAPKNVKEL